MTTQRKVHFLTLDVGELFRFAPGGRIFRRVVGKDDRAWIEDVGGNGSPTAPQSVVEFSGCYVYLVAEEDHDDDPVS